MNGWKRAVQKKKKHASHKVKSKYGANIDRKIELKNISKIFSKLEFLSI